MQRGAPWKTGWVVDSYDAHLWFLFLQWWGAVRGTKLEGRGLGPTSRALRGLGGCRQLLPLPEAGARHKEQVTQEQLHGLGVVVGQGRGQGLWLWERRLGGPRCQGPAPGCTAEALHPPHTCNATAMHRGAARSPGPQSPPPPPHAGPLSLAHPAWQLQERHRRNPTTPLLKLHEKQQSSNVSILPTFLLALY